MSEQDPTVNDAADAQGSDEDTAPVTPEEDTDNPDGAESLGDAGKKALDAMKAERKAAKDEARQLRKELEALKTQIADKEKSPDEKAIEAARREAAEEATTKANERILRSEVRAAAAGKLADPSDALAYLDLKSFEVSADGEVDSEEIVSAIAELLDKKPYLAAQRGPSAPKFDSARGKGKPAGQLTRADLKGMSPEAISKARKEGRLDALLSGKS